MYYVYGSVRAIPTYRVYRLYDNYIFLQCQFTFAYTVWTLGTVTVPMDVVMKIEYLCSIIQYSGNTVSCNRLLPGVEWGSPPRGDCTVHQKSITV